MLIDRILYCPNHLVQLWRTVTETLFTLCLLHKRGFTEVPVVEDQQCKEANAIKGIHNVVYGFVEKYVLYQSLHLHKELVPDEAYQVACLEAAQCDHHHSELSTVREDQFLRFMDVHTLPAHLLPSLAHLTDEGKVDACHQDEHE